MKKIVLLGLCLLFIASALAANDPGHDTLYVEENGSSEITGYINITNDLQVTGTSTTSGLVLYGDGTNPTGSSYIASASGGTDWLIVDAPGNLFLKEDGGDQVIVGSFSGTATDVNVSGNIWEQGVRVCLANGTNCLSGNNSGNVSSIIAGNGISVSGPTGDVTVSASAATCAGDEYSYWSGTAWLCRTDQDSGGTGDITDVGSMDSGAAFADATADDDWLGLGSGAGRIEFDDLATDEVNFLNASVGVGTSTPGAKLNILSTNNDAQVALITNQENSAWSIAQFQTDGSTVAEINRFGQISTTYGIDVSSVGQQLLVAIGNSPGLLVTPRLASHVTLGVQGQTSQTADLQNWQKNSTVIYSVVDNLGRFGVNMTNPQNELEVVGTINATAIQVGTNNVCQSDGTNCPGSGDGHTHDQNLNTTNSPSFAGLTITGTGDITMPANFFIGSGTAAAGGSNAIAIGTNANASDSYDISIGYDSNARGVDSIALGRSTITSANPGSISIGYQAYSVGNKGIAIGYQSNISNSYTVAIGYGATASALETIAIGRASASGTEGIAIGGLSNSTGAGVAIGHSAQTTNNGQVAIGRDSIAYGSNTIAIGVNANATTVGGGGMAIGARTDATSNTAIAIGQQAQSRGWGSIGVGYLANATEDSSIVLGREGDATGTDSLAIGHLTQATGTNSIAIGESANSAHTESVALGFNSATSTTNQFMVGASSDNLNTYIYGTLETTGVGTFPSGTTVNSQAICLADGTDCPAGSGNVSGTGVSTDNAIARWNGAGGDTIQNSGITIDDSDNIAGVGTLSAGATTVTTLNTGQGAYELYAMNQDVETTDDVTFDELTLTNNLTLTPVGLYSIVRTNDANARMDFITERSSASDAAFVFRDTAGTNHLLIRDNSNVEVWGDLDVGGELFSDINVTISPSGSVSRLRTGSNDARLDFVTDRSSSTNLAFSFRNEADTQHMVIRDDGNVGIGDTTPGELLEVAGNINSTGGDICITGGNCLSMISGGGGSDSAGGWTNTSILISSNVGDNITMDSGVMFVDATNDRVGIGTTNPSDIFELNSSTTYDLVLNSNTGGIGMAWNKESVEQASIRSGGGSSSTRLTYDGARHTFTVGGEEVIRVSSGGNAINPVYIGGQSATDAKLSILNENPVSGGDKPVLRLEHIASPTADYFQVSSNGATTGDIFVINSTGNVGIGTTSPDDTLHLESSAANEPRVRVDATGTGGNNQPGFAIYNEGGFEGGMFYEEGGDVAQIWGGGIVAINIDSTGNVGIGTSGPDGTLHAHTASAGSVTASVAADELIVEDSQGGGISILTPDANGGNIYWGSPSDNIGALIRWTHDDDLLRIGTANNGGDIAFETGASSEAMRILDSGNVGIGTSSPEYLLDVQSSDASSTYLRVENTNGGAQNTGIWFNNTHSDSPEGWFARVNTIGDLLITESGTGVAEFTIDAISGDVTINSDLTVLGVGNSSFVGNVGIGTSSPNALLHVEGASSGATGVNTVLLQAADSTSGSADGNKITLEGGNVHAEVTSGTGSDGGGIHIIAGHGANSSETGTSGGGGDINITAGATGKQSGAGSSPPGNIYLTTKNRLDGTGTYGDVIIAQNGGNVGVGNPSPSTALDITGTATATDFDCTDCIDADDLANSLSLDANLAITNGNVTIDSTTLKVDATNDRVGIGTSSPDYALEIESSAGSAHYLNVESTSASAQNTGLRWGNTAGNWTLRSNTVGDIIWRDATTGVNPFQMEQGAPTNTLYLEADGDVGIGIANPTEKFEVHETGASGVFIEIENSNAADQTVGIKLENTHADSGGWTIQNQGASGDFQITEVGTGGSEFTIDAVTGNVDIRRNLTVSGGELGVGTGSPDTSLAVNGYSTGTVNVVGELTIASGTIALPSHTYPGTWFVTVDTESDAATDDLDTVTGLVIGDILIMQSEDDGRDVTFKDAAGGTGDMNLAGSIDFTTSQQVDTIMLMAHSATTWIEVSRSDN